MYWYSKNECEAFGSTKRKDIKEFFCRWMNFLQQQKQQKNQIFVEGIVY